MPRTQQRPSEAPPTAAEPAAPIRFGAYELDPAAPELRRDGEPVEIGPTALHLLVALVEARGAFVGREALIERVWPGVTVTDASLYSALRAARRALGDDGRRQQVIETRKGRGYRLVAPIEPSVAGPLTRDQVCERLRGGHDRAPSAALVDRVLTRTGAEPELVEDLCDRLADADARGLPAVVAAESLPLSDRVLDAALARLPRLPDALRPALQAASVFGRELPRDLAERLGLDPVRTQARLAEAVTLGWLEPDPRGARRLRFRSAAARERLYTSIPRATRSAWHDAAARSRIEETATRELDAAREVAHHLRCADDDAGEGEALTWCRAAAEAALSARELDEAVAQYETALALASDAAMPERFELLAALGEVRFRVGDHDGGRDAFARAAALARAHGDGLRLARAALGHAGAVANTETASFSIERVTLLEEALAWAPTLDAVTRARLEARLAMDLRWSERRDEVPIRLDDALLGIREAPDATPADRISVLHDAWWASWTPGNLEERLRWAEEMVRLAPASDDPLHPLVAGTLHGASLLEKGDRVGAEAAYERGEQAVPSRSHAGLAFWSESLRACFSLLDGRFAEAESHMVRARHAGRDLGARNADVAFAAQLGWLRFDQGRLGELGAAVTVPIRTGIPLTRAGTALVLACAGRNTEAQSELEGLLEALDALPRDPFWIGTMATLVELSVRLRAPDAAARLAERLEPFADHCVVIGVRTVCRGSVALYLGLADGTRGRTSEAIAWLERAVRANARLRAAPILARSQDELARALHQRDAPGDAARARGLEVEAARTRAALGLAGHPGEAGGPGTAVPARPTRPA